MKQLIIITMTLLFGITAQARSKYELLYCDDINKGDENRLGVAQLLLDSTGYKEGSGFSKPVEARLHYLYTYSRDMTCIGTVRNELIDVKCVGFYHSNELSMVEFKTLEDGSYKAFWTTSQIYGSQKIESDCILKSRRLSLVR